MNPNHALGVLKYHGHVHQDVLAKRFARRFERDPDRGCGKMTRIQMQGIIAGTKGRDTAANAFGGQGSMGNGGAMRVTLQSARSSYWPPPALPAGDDRRKQQHWR